MIAPIARKRFTCVVCGAKFDTTARAKRCADCRKRRRSHYDSPGGERRPR
jgi:hypothetical protein